MTSSTAIPEWFIAHPYLQWIIPSMLMVAFILLIVAVWLNEGGKDAGS